MYAQYSLCVTTIFGGCSLMIALVHPYKKAYMNIIDVLILGIMALIGLMLNTYYMQVNTYILLLSVLIVSIIGSLPLLGLSGFITYKVLMTTQVRRGELDVQMSNNNVKHQIELENIFEDTSNKRKVVLIEGTPFRSEKITNFSGNSR